MLKHPKSNSRKRILISIFLLAAAAGAIFLFANRGDSNPSNYNASTLAGRNSNSAGKPTDETESHVAIPATLQLKVPFTPQAPTANWDELHNEACEEASLIMANAYFHNITSLPPATVEKEITKLTDWQKEQYGYYLSITTAETARMAEEVYGLQTEIVAMTETAIKQALTDGKLVILPVQGQLLGNPNFTPPGPIYHMLVITGYNSKEFITNDPGTRKGFNYKYSYDTLEQAAGTWSHTAHEVDTTNKRVIIVWK